MKRVTEVLIDNPMVVARDGNAVVFVAADNVPDLHALTNSQLYDPAIKAYSPVMPLGTYGKFMPYIQEVDPPEPFATPT